VRPRRYRKRRIVSSSYSSMSCQCCGLGHAMRRLLHIPLTRLGGRASCRICSCACSMLRRASCDRRLARRPLHCSLWCWDWCPSPGGVSAWGFKWRGAGGKKSVLCSLVCPGSTATRLLAWVFKRDLAAKHAPSPRRGWGKSARVALTPNFLKPLILVSCSWS
jgi:hypothetical protein